MEEYGKPSYWDARYLKEPETFDWYQNYCKLKPIINQYIPNKSSRILMVGCGNSNMSYEMWVDGYTEMLNIDISPVVIDMMNANHPNLKWETADICTVDYPSESFDASIDKGTLDAILCGEGSVEKSFQLLSNICRMLKPGGIHIMITYGQPHSRMSELKKPELAWTVDYTVIAKQRDVDETTPTYPDDYHYIYLMKKKDDVEPFS